MKKIFTLLNLAALLGVCAVFTSCESDPDVEESIVISGEWYGDWGMYYDYQYSNGRIERFDSYDTDIEFIPDYDYATHGYGYQVDWYRYGPYERLSYKFYWNIRNGIIQITYPGNHHYDVNIYDYHLDYNYFTGRFSADGNVFRLRKLSDFYWNDYYAYDYYEWGWDYYSKARSVGDGDSVNVSAPEGQVVKIGSHLNE